MEKGPRIGLKVAAAAKVNLDLRVVGSRADGYHLIDSLVAPVSLYDTVLIRSTAGAGITLRCSDPTLPAGKRNLVWRAADLVLRLRGVAAHVEIDLTKRIPMGAGLGGGSTDAAAVLLGLNALLGLRISRRELARVGVALGADVPFCVRGRPAVVRGIGEEVEVLRDPPRRWLLIAWPGFAISTAQLYAQYDRSLTKTSPVPMIGRSARGPRSRRGVSMNDLEAAAVAAHPELRSLKEKILALGAVSSRMTGSGSAFFGVFRSRRKAVEGATELRRAGIWAEAVHTIEHTPSIEVEAP